MFHKAVNHIHVQQLNAIKKLLGFTGTQGIGVSDISSGVDNEERLEADLNGLDNETANNDLDKQLSTITDFMLQIQDWCYI